MSTKLTKRDKTLLYIMAIVLVCFGFVWFIIFPQMNKSGELDASINELEAKKLPIEAAVMSVDKMGSLFKEKAMELDEAMAGFYPYMENYEIDKMFTGLLVDDYGLTVTNLDMSAIPVGTMASKYMSWVTEEESESTESSSTEGSASSQASGTETTESTESSATEIPAAEPDIETIPVVTSSIFITASGDKAKAQALIDDIFNNYPSIHISGYSISDGGALTLNCDLYMKAK